MLDDIALFIKVVEAGSFLKASQLHSLHHGTISRRMKALETTLNCKLFILRGNRMTLTDSGESVYQRFAHTLKEANMLLEDLHGSQSSFTLVVPLTLQSMLINSDFTKIIETHPEINLSIKTNYYSDNEIGYNFDLGVSYSFPPKSYFTRQLLIPVFAKLYTSPEYVEKYGIPISLEELVQHKFIGIMDQNRKAYQKLMLEHQSGTVHEIMLENIAVTCDSIISAGLFAHSGSGIAALINSHNQVINLFSGLNLIEVLPEYRICTEHAVYLVSSSRLQTPQKKLFMKFIRETLLKCLG